MPTTINTTHDSYNINHFFAHYSNLYEVVCSQAYHSYTYAICYLQNIICVVLADQKHLFESTATIINERLIHQEYFNKIKIKLKQTQPLTLTPQQKFIYGLIKFILKSKKAKH